MAAVRYIVDDADVAVAFYRDCLGFEPGPEVRLRTLESAVSCGGVCERVFTPVQLASYRPMRLRRR